MTNQLILKSISTEAKQVIKKAVLPLPPCFIQLEIQIKIVLRIAMIEKGIGISS
jgi:hypothetical protein